MIFPPRIHCQHADPPIPRHELSDDMRAPPIQWNAGQLALNLEAFVGGITRYGETFPRVAICDFRERFRIARCASETYRTANRGLALQFRRGMELVPPIHKLQ